MRNDDNVTLRTALPAHGELNPYASPAEAGGYDASASAGIGVWRDGNYVVLHRDAAFPPICLRTGEAATRHRKYALYWSYPLDWSHRRLSLRLPLCDSAYNAYRVRWLIGIMAVVLPLLILFTGLATYGENNLPNELVALLLFVTPVCFLTWRILRWWDGKPLKFVRIRDKYFWLSGAYPQFLAQLPPWTSGS